MTSDHAAAMKHRLAALQQIIDILEKLRQQTSDDDVDWVCEQLGEG